MKIFLFILILVAVSFVLYVRYLERHALFFPEKDITLTPEDVGLAYEDVHLTSKNGEKIHGWYLKAEYPRATILYLHGNAGNISDRVEKLRILHELGLNVLIMDYQGYGQSGGAPSERALLEDSRAGYHFLRDEKNIPADKIILYGSSLGGVPAISLAYQKPAGALILDSVFTSAVDMARIYYPYVPSFLINIKLDNAAHIRDLKIPKLFIHSPEDEVVPFRLGQKLYDLSSDPKHFLTLKGAHVNAHFDDGQKLRDGLDLFLKEQGFVYEE